MNSPLLPKFIGGRGTRALLDYVHYGATLLNPQFRPERFSACRPRLGR